MLCRQKCWGADYVFQEFNAQVLQVGVPLKVLSHTFGKECFCVQSLKAPGRAWSPSASGLRARAWWLR